MSSFPKNISPWLDSVPDARKFPVLNCSVEADIVVIGGGIAGIMAAWKLAESGKKVVLLEKNHIATGDTGLTTAFLTRVPDVLSSMIVEKYGIDFMRDVFAVTREVQHWIFDLIRSKNIDCDFEKCNSFFSSYIAGDEHLMREWKVYKQVDAECDFVQQGDVFAPFKEAVQFRHEGKFHIRKFLFGLISQRPNNFEIFEESEVLDIDVGSKVTVTTRDGSVTAEKVVVCVGNPAMIFPELENLAETKISYVIAARYAQVPLSQDVFWDTLDPYFYYRRLDERTMIVGGCDIASDKTSTQKPFEKLSKFLDETFHEPHEITHRWSGSIFHTSDDLPYVFEHPYYAGKVFVAWGFGGNGMVMGVMSGRIVADLALGLPEIRLFSLNRTGVEISKPVSKKAHGIGRKMFMPFAAVSEFAGKPLVCKMIEGQKIVAFKLGHEFYAISNTCTHAGGSLCDGPFDGNIIECPLHGGTFDVRTGAATSPPAMRALRKYPLRVNDDTIEIEVEQFDASEKPAMPVNTDPLDNFKSLLKFSFFSLVFWLVQFAMQYYWLTKGEFGGSLLRSFGLSGATFFAVALFLSAIFKWWPGTSLQWRLRRRFGVAGFIFIVFHVLSAMHFFFDYDLASIYYSLNPIENPIIFGSIAFPIFFLMAATSTDWMVNKLGAKKWKFIHRFVYVAYVSSIFHFVTINPSLLNNPPGYLLLTLTAAALFGQLYWYIRTITKRGFKAVGTWVGIAIILATLATGYAVYDARYRSVEEEPMAVSVERMKEFMVKNPGDPEVSVEPMSSEKDFQAEVLRRGSFVNLHYMTNGDVSLQKKGEQYFMVFEDNFVTPNGPDLQIYLTKNSDPTQRHDVAQGILLGKLKSLKGKQFYEIPAGTDVAQYNSFSIHCKAFNVPWSYAPLDEE